MKIRHLVILALCLAGLSFATPAQAQYRGGYVSGYHGGYVGGYHGGYVNYGYRPYAYGYGYRPYGYYPYGCYGGGFYGGNNTVGILFGAASIVNAIGGAVAANNNQPWNAPVQQESPAPAQQAPTHVTVVNQIPATHSESNTSANSKPLPHGYITDQGTIRSPWSNSQVPASGVTSGTVLFDAFTGQRYAAP